MELFAGSRSEAEADAASINARRGSGRAGGVETVFKFGFDPLGKSDLVDWLRTKFGMLD